MSPSQPSPDTFLARLWAGPLSRAGCFLLVGVLLVQGVHVIEHVIVLGQVYLAGTSVPQAHGLLGIAFEIRGNTAWLHLGFNLLYGMLLYLVAWHLWPLRRTVIPMWAWVYFATVGLALQTWHVAEHVVMIRNELANAGCPCDGVVDSDLGVPGPVLHLAYNGATYLGLLVAAWFVLRRPAPGTIERQARHQWKEHLKEPQP